MPKKTPTQLDTLRADRAALQARHAEITADRDAAAAELADAQADLIDGEADAAERVTTAQARVNGSDGALAMIAERIDRLDVQIEDAERAASRASHLATLHTSAEAAEDARRRYYETAAAARDALAEHARQAEALDGEWGAASKTFIGSLKSLTDAGEDQDDVLGVLASAGVSDKAALSERFHHVQVGVRAGRLPDRYSPAPDLGTGGEHAHAALTQMRDLLNSAARREASREADRQRFGSPSLQTA